MPPTSDKDLDALLKQVQGESWATLLPDELKLLIEAFLPDIPRSVQSKAYIVLSSLSQRFRDRYPPTTDNPDTYAESMSRLLSPIIIGKLADTNEKEVLSGFTFMTAFFQVDWQTAAAILNQDGVVESITDSLELFASSLPISRAVAQLASQAAGHKSCRAIIPSQCIEWLEAKSRRSDDSTLQAAAAVALIKLSRGASADAAAITGAQAPAKVSNDEQLLSAMKGLVVSDNNASINDAIEGLAYMSTDSSVKEVLSKDAQFLSHLFSIIPRRKGRDAKAIDADDLAVTPIYGTILIISNLCARPPRLTEEESQIAKLRRMASAANKGGSKMNDLASDLLEDEQHIQERARRLMNAGVMDALTAAVRITDSKATRLAVGRTLLNLVEDRDNRGKVLQAGGAKALTTVIQSLLPPSRNGPSKPEELPQLDRAEMEPIQALAKLAITSSPLQVFGPNEGALYDAIRPLVVMLLHSSSHLLQRFEAIMALTNISSQSQEAATRIVKFSGLMDKVELLMLEDHTLVRRAATELICNLIAGSEDVFNRYGGEKTGGAKSKLHVLLALCDVEDLPTRLAASGALATVTVSPHACRSLLELQREKHRALPILGQLIDPSIKNSHDDEDEVEEIRSPGTADQDPGLVHRGVVCLRNILTELEKAETAELGKEIQELGIAQALIRVFRNGASNPQSPVVRPAAEALKALMDSGLSIST